MILGMFLAMLGRPRSSYIVSPMAGVLPHPLVLAGEAAGNLADGVQFGLDAFGRPGTSRWWQENVRWPIGNATEAFRDLSRWDDKGAAFTSAREIANLGRRVVSGTAQARSYYPANKWGGYPRLGGGLMALRYGRWRRTRFQQRRRFQYARPKAYRGFVRGGRRWVSSLPLFPNAPPGTRVARQLAWLRRHRLSYKSPFRVGRRYV